MNSAISAIRYTRPAIILHWVMAAVMIFMLFFSEDLIHVHRGQSLGSWEPTTHASFGLLVLFLVIARLLWRIGNPPPPMLSTMPRWQAIASHGTHYLFYALMIIIPIFGLFAIVPYGAARLDVDQVTFFKLFPVAFMPNLGMWTGDVHGWLATAGEVLVIVHIAAALKHQFWDKDRLLQRMNPFSR